MFVIHEVQLQKVCGSDNWMTPREGKKHEKKKSFSWRMQCLVEGQPVAGQAPWPGPVCGAPLAKAASSKSLVPGPRPHPTLSGSMLSPHFGSWDSRRENYIFVSKWATELEKANCL